MIHCVLQKRLDAPMGNQFLDIEFRIEEGEILSLFGPSGAGKTSILRMIAGLLMPDRGMVRVADETWFDWGRNVNLIPQQRKIGYMFQDASLFPNMTVRENIEYGLSRSKGSSVDELVEIFDLGDLQSKKPLTLSGGQKQRVALAQAVGRQPKVLLLDEPFAALDDLMRQKMQDYILDIHRRNHLTVILVSHDVGEIFRLSNRVILIDHGKIIRTGSPDNVFSEKKLSGKFQFAGKILSIAHEEVVLVLNILVGNTIVKVILDQSEMDNLSVGDNVLIASKAFNPIVKKI